MNDIYIQPTYFLSEILPNLEMKKSVELSRLVTVHELYGSSGDILVYFNGVLVYFEWGGSAETKVYVIDDWRSPMGWFTWKKYINQYL